MRSMIICRIPFGKYKDEQIKEFEEGRICGTKLYIVFINLGNNCRNKLFFWRVMLWISELLNILGTNYLLIIFSAWITIFPSWELWLIIAYLAKYSLSLSSLFCSKYYEKCPIKLFGTDKTCLRKTVIK